MNNLVSLIIAANLFTGFLACNNANKTVEIERVKLKHELITDSIYTRMPGTLLNFGDYLVWQDIFASDYFCHIIDAKSKKEIAVIGKIGQGPNEYTTPDISYGGSNRVLTIDLNTKLKGLLSIDSAIQGKNYFIPIDFNMSEDVTNVICLNDKTILTFDPLKEEAITAQKNGVSKSFGKAPIDDKISNKFTIFQSAIEYNEDKKLLVCANTQLPHIAIFERKGNTDFTLKHEKKVNVNYIISGGKLQRKPDKYDGSTDMTLTKDYIVSLERDYANPNRTNYDMGIGTIFLYGYKGNLKKIVDLGMPVFRIAGNIKNNTLYFMAPNPEFMLMKVEL